MVHYEYNSREIILVYLYLKIQLVINSLKYQFIYLSMCRGEELEGAGRQATKDGQEGEEEVSLHAIFHFIFLIH